MKCLTLAAAIAASVIPAIAQPAARLDRVIVKSTVDSACALLSSNYVFPETAAKMAKLLRKNLNSGDYDRLGGPEALAERVTADMRSVSKDKHLGLLYSPQRIALMRGDTVKGVNHPEIIRMNRRENFGFYKVERLPGNVGYLDLRGFYDPKQPGAGEAAVAAMNFLANAQAVIFDLRRNGGGWPDMIQLISTYLFEEETHLNDLYNRPTDFTQQYWILPWVPGPRLAKIPVYVLTSGYTFSGAEEFSNNLKELKRSTIVGQTTGGGAHPVDIKIINDQFALKVSIGRAINPVSKKNWEGTGVEPHVKVPADSALDFAYLMALDTLYKTAANPDEKEELANRLAIKRAEMAAFNVPEATLRKYQGRYGIRNISYQGGRLFFQREQGPKWRLLPVAERSFVIDEVGGQVTFTTGADGGIDGFDLIRSVGDTVHCPRQRME
jgi:hypothetical protein